MVLGEVAVSYERGIPARRVRIGRVRTPCTDEFGAEKLESRVEEERGDW